MNNSLYPRKLFQKGFAFTGFLAILLALAKYTHPPIPQLDSSMLHLNRKSPLDYG